MITTIQAQELKDQITELKRIGDWLSSGTVGKSADLIAKNTKAYYNGKRALEAYIDNLVYANVGDFRTENIETAMLATEFTRTHRCCDVPDKYCSTDTYKGSLEGFAKALLNLHRTK